MIRGVYENFCNIFILLRIWDIINVRCPEILFPVFGMWRLFGECDILYAVLISVALWGAETEN